MNNKRKKIIITLDENTIIKLKYISENLLLSKSKIIDELIVYTLKKELITENIERQRIKITTTVNNLLWTKFQDYTNKLGIHYNSMIEYAMLKQYRNLKRKINIFQNNLLR